MKTRLLYALALVTLLATLPLLAQSEKINYADINKIKAEGMQRSQVMELNSWLSDVYAPRVTGSPTIERAAQWVMGKLKEWGLVNIKMEPWANRSGFERGWTNDKFYLAAVTPERFAIPGTPTAWTPGTNGLVTGEVVLVTATTAEGLAPYKGKLKGKWVMTQAAPDVAAYWAAPATRYTTEQLLAMEGPQAQAEFGVAAPGGGGRAAGGTPAPGGPGAPAAAQQAQPPQGQRAAGAPAAAGQPQPPGPGGGRGGAANVRNDFFRAEGVLGTLSTAPRGHGLYTIGGSRTADPATTLPAVVIGAEHYGRIAGSLRRTSR